MIRFLNFQGLEEIKLRHQIRVAKRKAFLLVLGILLCILFLTHKALGQNTSPSVVVILADDLGYGDVSRNGCPDYQTPNIDSIGTNGAWCTSGYVTCSICSPSRAGLITGRYPERFGFDNQIYGDFGLPLTEITLAQILKQSGYATGAIGKWHLGKLPTQLPHHRGFDEFFGYVGDAPHYYNAHLFRNDVPLTERSYSTEAFSREAVSFINRHAPGPFFLYLAHEAPHSPYDIPPQQYMDRVSNITDPDRRIYAAMITALDDSVGTVLRTLREDGILNNTLIFFLSDNGAPHSAQWEFTRNDPLRGGKGSLLEGGIRVPFAVQWPDRLRPGNYDQPVSSLDIVATAADAADATLPIDRVYDGLNIIPYLSGYQPSPSRNLFWRMLSFSTHLGPMAVRSDSLKWLKQGGLLYDVATNPSESPNLSRTDPADVNRLRDLYSAWDAQMIQPQW